MISDRNGYIWGRAILILLGSGFFLFVRKVLVGRFSFYEDEIAFAVAPFLTTLISVTVLTEHMQKHLINKPNNIGSLVWFNLFSIGVIISLCGVLSGTHSWDGHLLSLLALFVYFILWDSVTSVQIKSGYEVNGQYNISDMEKTRNEVLNGRKYVNIPTLFAILCIGSYLLLSSKMHFIDGDIHRVSMPVLAKNLKPEELSFVDNSIKSNSLMMFASGFVMFHLAFSAAGYAVISWGDAIAKKFGGFFVRGTQP